MKVIRSALLAVALTVSSGSFVFAQDYNKGLAAYEAGDFATALVEVVPLARQGNANARYILGMMYLLGKGVSKDVLEGLQLIRLAADKGLYWYRLGAEGGDLFSQEFLGVIAQNEGDYVQANKWNSLAARQGNERSQLQLAINYYRGYGVSPDLVRAYMWFEISSRSGEMLSNMFRNQLAEKMTPAHISKAQAMARECMNSGYKNCGW